MSKDKRPIDADALTVEEREDVDAIREQLREWAPDEEYAGIGGGPTFERYLEDVRILLNVVDRLTPACADDVATITDEDNAE